MDEVFGFAPPTAAPPAKKPILTLLKQARAFGVGMVLATQNPVDLDYKAISNAGTWMVGRLQTERDKARLLEGLRSAGGDADIGRSATRSAASRKREFLLHDTHDRGGPKLFTTRWAMSYLRGPLTREQIGTLEPDTRDCRLRHERSVPAASTPAAAVCGRRERGRAGGGERRASVLRRSGRAVARDSRRSRRARASRRPSSRGCTCASTTRRPASTNPYEWEAVLYPLGSSIDPAAAQHVDYDARDLRPEAPAGASYVLPDAPIRAALVLHRPRARPARPPRARAEARAAVEPRAQALRTQRRESPRTSRGAATRPPQAAADAEAAKLRARYDAKIERVRDAIERAQDRVQVLETDTSTRRTTEVMSVVGDILGGFLGGSRSTRSIATGARRVLRGASSRRGVSARTAQRLSTAQGQVTEQQEDLEDLEAELEQELAEINEPLGGRWQDHRDRRDRPRAHRCHRAGGRRRLAAGRLIARARCVTGGTGFVGSHSVAELLRAGHEVTLLVRSRDRVDPALRPFGFGLTDVATIEGDVTDATAVERASRAARPCCMAPRCSRAIRALPPRSAPRMCARPRWSSTLRHASASGASCMSPRSSR